jgi:hypothetical protein
MYHNKVRTKNHRINFKKFKTKKNKRLKGGANTIAEVPEEIIICNKLYETIRFYLNKINPAEDVGIIGGPIGLLEDSGPNILKAQQNMKDLKEQFFKYNKKVDEYSGEKIADYTKKTINDMKPFLNENISEVEINNELNKAEIVISSFHGGIDFDFQAFTNFKDVPPKTIIFFTTPLGYQTDILLSKKKGNINFIDYFENLSVSDFKKLFLLRSTLSNLDRTILLPHNIHNDIIFSCFKHGTWYYPGQKYPDLDLGLEESDLVKNYVTNDFSFYKLYLESNSKVSKKNAIFENLLEKPNNKYNSIADIESKLLYKDIHFGSTLSKFIGTNENSNGGYRLFIIPSCRYIQNSVYNPYSYLKNLISYETILNNINTKLDHENYISNSSIINGIISQNKIGHLGKLPLCNMEKDEYILLETSEIKKTRFYEKLDTWLLHESEYISTLIKKYMDGGKMLEKEAFYICYSDLDLLIVFLLKMLELGTNGEILIDKLFEYGRIIIQNRIKKIIEYIEEIYYKYPVLLLYYNSDDMYSRVFIPCKKLFKYFITYYSRSIENIEICKKAYARYEKIEKKQEEYNNTIYFQGKNKVVSKKINPNIIKRIVIEDKFLEDKFLEVFKNDVVIQNFKNLTSFIVSLSNITPQKYSIIFSNIDKFKKLQIIKIDNVSIDKELDFSGLPFLREVKIDGEINSYIINIKSKFKIQTICISDIKFLEFININCEVENLFIEDINSFYSHDYATQIYLEADINKITVSNSFIMRIYINKNLNNLELKKLQYRDGFLEFNEGKKYNLSSVFFNGVDFIEELNKKMFDPRNIKIRKLEVLSSNMNYLIDAFNRSKYTSETEKIIRLRRVQRITLEFQEQHEIKIDFICNRLITVIKLNILGNFKILNDPNSNLYKRIIGRRGVKYFRDGNIKIENSILSF